MTKEKKYLQELGSAWVIIASANPLSKEWIQSAEKWHDRYIEILKEELREKENNRERTNY